jgi:DNA repair protein RadD
MSFELRDYQCRAMEVLRETVARRIYRVVLASPTGSGKTALASAIADGCLRKGNRLAFVVPALSLIDQTVEMFRQAGVTDIGVIQQDHERTWHSAPIQICSIQTLQARRWIPECAVAVFDEVHQMHKWHLEWLGREEWKNRPIFGLSATPWTKGLGRYFAKLLVVATTKDMIEQGILSPFKVFSVAAPDLSKVRTVAGDYHEGELAEAMDDHGKLTADIVETWQKQWGQDKTLCFAVNLAHARQLYERFAAAGVVCAYQDGSTPADERARIRESYTRGETQVIVSVGTLTTGVDLDVRCISLCRPTKSEMLFVQMVGRGLRKAPGKDFLLLLDHTTTTERLGFVTDIHYDRLDDGRKKRAAKVRETPLPTPCEQCGFLPPKREQRCSNCGFEKPMPVSDRVEGIGELVEWTASGQRDGAGVVVTPAAVKRDFYAQLLWVGRSRSYKDGWAAVQFKERFGEWPPWGWVGMIEAQAPGPLVLSWVRHRMIKYAKSRRAGRHSQERSL